MWIGAKKRIGSTELVPSRVEGVEHGAGASHNHDEKHPKSYEVYSMTDHGYDLKSHSVETLNFLPSPRNLSPKLWVSPLLFLSGSLPAFRESERRNLKLYTTPIVVARKLEHHYPHALKVNYKGS